MNSVVVRVMFASLVTAAIVWALILGWWQANDFSPTTSDLLLYLGGIPLSLLLGYWLLRGFIEHLGKPVTVDEASTPNLPLDDDPLAPARKVSDAAARQFSLLLLDAMLETAVGQSGDDVVAALQSGQRPEPSEDLVDAQGFPAFAAAIPDLDTESLAERLDANPDMANLVSRPAGLRLLALLDRVASRLESALEDRSAGKVLRVILIVPAEWVQGELPALRGWLQTNYWQAFSAPPPELLIVPATNNSDVLQKLDDEIVRANSSRMDNELIALIGAVSNIDQQIIDQWSDHGRLFGPEAQDGEIPGEAAVALLLAKAGAPDAEAGSTVTLGRIAQGRRDKRLDAGGRVSGQLVETLFADVLAISGVSHQEVGSLVLDADHRSRQLAEAMTGGGEGLAHLEPVEDVLPSSAVTGSVDPIGPLLALACARTRVLADTRPALCLSNHAPLERAALLVRPIPADTQPESENT